MRLRRGQGKWLMKKAMERYLPENVLYRPKMGFVPPISAWFRGALADEAQGLAVSKTLSATGWFDMPAVQYLAEDHRAGKPAHGRTLGQLSRPERSEQRRGGKECGRKGKYRGSRDQ